MKEEVTYPATQSSLEIHRPGERPKQSSDVLAYVRQYARERPEVVALWCLGIGFVLGWKAKMW